MGRFVQALSLRLTLRFNKRDATVVHANDCLSVAYSAAYFRARACSSIMARMSQTHLAHSAWQPAWRNTWAGRVAPFSIA